MSDNKAIEAAVKRERKRCSDLVFKLASTAQNMSAQMGGDKVFQGISNSLREAGEQILEEPPEEIAEMLP